MTDTINNQIPFVPENTIDPAAGLNLSLNTIDALLQVLVQTVGANTPPAGVEGQRHIVGTSPTGAWAGQANKVARFLDGAWQFFSARYALNAADGLWYVRSASTWSALAGSAPAWGSITGTLSAQTDLQGALDGKVGTGDSRLTDAREWTATTVAQAEAEAGTATTRRAWTAQRVRQAIVAWWNGISSAWGRGFVASDDAVAGRTALALGNAATRTALGTTGQLYSRDSILGTVSQSGGIPTGAIIERGSNANGEYVRWADGTQICWDEGPTLYTANLAAGSLFYNNGQAFTYPAAFSGVKPPAVSAANRRITEAVFGFTYSASNTAVSVGAYSPGNTSTFYAAYIAIGRWFP